VNIRELDEESRRTGVWPPRRIILRVEDGEAAEQAADGRSAPVRVDEVDLNAPRAVVATPKPREVPPLPAPSLSPSVTPSRRRGLPGSQGVTPAPAASSEDAAFEQWVAAPLPDAPADPEYQEPPAWLPDDVRVRAERRHRRVARKARTQMFGASAATMLAIGGCAAALAVVGLSQTEAVGGSLGIPTIGLFGTAPERTSDDAANTAVPKPAANKTAPTQRTRRQASSGDGRRRQASSGDGRRRQASSGGGRARSARAAQPARPARTSRAAAPQRASTAPARSTAPAQPVRNQPAPAPVQQRRVSNPPPPPPPAAPQPAQDAPIVFNTPSRPTTSAPAPSRPVPSAPAPTTSAPAP